MRKCPYRASIWVKASINEPRVMTARNLSEYHAFFGLNKMEDGFFVNSIQSSHFYPQRSTKSDWLSDFIVRLTPRTFLAIEDRERLCGIRWSWNAKYDKRWSGDRFLNVKFLILCPDPRQEFFWTSTFTFHDDNWRTCSGRNLSWKF